MPAVQFVPYKPHEFCELRNWVQQYFEHDGLNFNQAVEMGIQQLLDSPEYGVAWKIFAEEEQVGYLVVTFGFDYEVGGRTGVITDLYLIQSARGQGIGSAAMEHCSVYAKEIGLQSIELFVLHHNKGARALYERFGFRALPDRGYMSRSI
jgi:ribosomal protein S18 acetylase RimI-like enzyme